MKPIRDSIRAVYRVSAKPSEVEKIARDIAIEQTVEIPDAIIPPRIRENVVGKIRSIRPAANGGPRAETFDVVVDYDPRLCGGQFPHFLNLIYGNTSLQKNVRLADFQLPDSFLRLFKGPNYGVAGIRRLTGVYGRPLLSTALKPNGATTAQLAALARDFALGRGDILKDDQNLVDADARAFRERVARCFEAVEAANRSTGRRTLYCPIVTAPGEDIEERMKILSDLGVPGLLAAPMLIGLDRFRELAAKYGSLVFIAHPSMMGTLLTRASHGIEPELAFGKLLRWIGSDAVIFPNVGGRFPITVEDCASIRDALLSPWNNIAAAMPMPAGGIQLEHLPSVLRDYGEDSVLLLGGALLGHPKGVRKGTEELLAAIRRKYSERLEKPQEAWASACELPHTHGTGNGKYSSPAASDASNGLLAFAGFRWKGKRPTTYKSSGKLPFKDVARHELVGSSDLKAAFDLRYFELGPGGYTSLEKHAHTHAIIGLRGRGILLKGGRKISIKPRDVAMVGPLEVHQLRNESAKPFGFFCIVDRDRDRPMRP